MMDPAHSDRINFFQDEDKLRINHHFIDFKVIKTMNYDQNFQGFYIFRHLKNN